MSREYTPLHKPKNSISTSHIPFIDSPFDITVAFESKPDFPIVPPRAEWEDTWTQDFGEEVSMYTDVFGLGVSAIKLAMSLGAEWASAHAADPLFTPAAADVLESRVLDPLSIGADVLGEVATGRTRLAVEPNGITLIAGQETTLSGLSYAIDSSINSPQRGTKADIVLNAVELAYTAGKLIGWIPDFAELQVSTNQPTPNYVIYTGEFE